jgi:hypothetical protein
MLPHRGLGVLALYLIDNLTNPSRRGVEIDFFDGPPPLVRPSDRA